MVLAFDGDSTMTRSCVAPLLLLAAGALRVRRTAAALAAVVADAAFLRPFVGSAEPSAGCFLRAGTGRSLLFREGAALPISGCRCVRFQTRYNHHFGKLRSSPIIYLSAGCQGRQGRQPGSKRAASEDCTWR